MTNIIPDLHLTGDSQCFPFYTYDTDGRNRRENITAWAVNQFQARYGRGAETAPLPGTKWDIFYYVFLKATIGWPSSIFEYDVLFLIPYPWIGPVIAPSLVALLMIIIGVSIIRLYEKGYSFKPTPVTWLLAIAATSMILYSFMSDTDVALRLSTPCPYLYWLLISGLTLYIIAYLHSYQRAIRI